MSEISAFWLVAASFGGIVIGVLLSFLIQYGRKNLTAAQAPITAGQSSSDESPVQYFAITSDSDGRPVSVPIASDFAVTGKPLKPSWRLRKRELEAASRTKRKQLESFREIG